MLDHWDPLTLFLREPGAPLDNNLCERALKKAILHRKNALFWTEGHSHCKLLVWKVSNQKLWLCRPFLRDGSHAEVG